MKNTNVIGIDLAKHVIQVCKIDKHGELLSNKAISPSPVAQSPLRREETSGWWGMLPEIFETNIGEPVRRRALSIRYRSQAHPLTRNQSGENLVLGSSYS